MKNQNIVLIAIALVLAFALAPIIQARPGPRPYPTPPPANERVSAPQTSGGPAGSIAEPPGDHYQ